MKHVDSMKNEKWVELLNLLKRSVTKGTITAYGELSLMFYGHSGGALAIGTLLKIEANTEPRNIKLTNRVIKSNGQLIKHNQQDVQLA